ncbi:MAG: hypothetical protein DMF56_06385 [Acidobacteria bacterium]|nr:MAG: hypothetical protein DMF56_06385 [Acidobacteriota bacterium]
MNPEPQAVPKKKSPWVWVGLGCGILFVGFIAFCAFIFFVVFGAMRRSEPYRHAIAVAQSDPRVIATLGSPVKVSFFFTGSINTHNNDGDAKLDIPISGPKGAGILHVTATKTDGKWFYNRMYVKPLKGDEIDLMSSP